jgi:hypothetical protein
LDLGGLLGHLLGSNGSLRLGQGEGCR